MIIIFECEVYALHLSTVCMCELFLRAYKICIYILTNTHRIASSCSTCAKRQALRGGLPRSSLVIRQIITLQYFCSRWFRTIRQI